MVFVRMNVAHKATRSMSTDNCALPFTVPPKNVPKKKKKRERQQKGKTLNLKKTFAQT